MQVLNVGWFSVVWLMSVIAKFGVKKLETSLYRMVGMHFDIWNRLGVDHECDRQTNGETSP